MYATTVKDKKLTLTVSGRLWKRSLVMMDIETKSLWSHLLGEAMDGELKGEKLEPLPAQMTTWAAWKQQHPKTTVLDMSRTFRNYDKSVYRKPQQYAIGLNIAGKMFHATFESMIAKPLLNVTLNEWPVLISYDIDSTAARVFDRKVGQQVLEFESKGKDRIVDSATGSTWDTVSGQAIDGTMKGKTLRHMVAIPSYTRAWMMFHPDSQIIGK